VVMARALRTCFFLPVPRMDCVNGGSGPRKV